MAEDSDESEESEGSEGAPEGESLVADSEERGGGGDGLRWRRRGLGGLSTKDNSGDSVRSITTGGERMPGDEQEGYGGETARRSSISLAGLRRRVAPPRQSKVRPRDCGMRD